MFQGVQERSQQSLVGARNDRRVVYRMRLAVLLAAGVLE